MKITKELCELKLDVDLELSAMYKDELGHETKMCYDNTYQLLSMGMIDTYVIGWVIIKDGGIPFPVRHGFGIKDGKIVDSTLHSDMLPLTRYFTMLEISKEDFFKIYEENELNGTETYTSLDGYVGYDVENTLQMELMKLMGVL